MDKWKFSGILVGVLLSVLMFGKYVVTFGEESKIPITTSHEQYYLDDDLMDGFVEVKDDNIYHYDKYKIPKKGWISDKNNVKRYFSNGLIVDGWYNIDGCQYYFEKDGVCVTGCQSIDGEDYYFDNRGRLQYGERIFGQDVYMYDLVDGHMLRDTWYKHDGLVQYVDLDGRLIVSSFYDLNGNTYYFDENGNKCVSDWINLSNNRYYFDEHGRLCVNKEVLTSTGERVYLADDGRSLKNQWHEDTYYNENGYAASIDEIPVLELDARGFFNGPLGDMGRLYIPSVGVDVALYWVGPYDGNAQATCDSQDAAVWMGPEWDDYIGWGDVIADHWNQGFDAIKSCQAGNKAYIVTADRIRVYECVGIDYDGHNLEYTCVDSQGRSLWQISDIVMYTCNENWQHITCVFWTQII